jgi:hypothetical protein
VTKREVEFSDGFDILLEKKLSGASKDIILFFGNPS